MSAKLRRIHNGIKNESMNDNEEMATASIIRSVALDHEALKAVKDSSRLFNMPSY